MIATKATIVIPARLFSHRLPSKILLAETGHPLIWHTVQNALQSKLANSVVVAVDDLRVSELLTKLFKQQIGVVYTKPNFTNGTARIMSLVGTEYLPRTSLVVNLQADEAELEGHRIDTLIDYARQQLSDDDGGAKIATLSSPCTLQQRLVPSVVKVVTDHQDRALYFSRSPIPYQGPSFKHIGIYAFTPRFMEEYPALIPGKLDGEQLEQLGWLENGYRIKVCRTDIETVGIDTRPEYDSFIARWRAANSSR